MPTPTTETQFEQFYEERSLLLHEEKRFDQAGRPTRSNSFDFRNKKNVIREKLNQLESLKVELRELKKNHQIYLKSQPHLPSKAKPTGKRAEEINRLEGKKKVVEKELRFLNKILLEDETADNAKLAKLRERYAHKGCCKLVDGLIARCDWRDVEYKQGKPFFVDDGSSVDEYLAQCKAEKLARARALKQVVNMEIAQRKHAEKNEIESKKILVDEQLRKIRRRQAPSQSA